MNIVSVKFKKDGKGYYFDSNDLELNVDDYVLVETEKGIQFGIVKEVNIDSSTIKFKSDLKSVIKKADDKDYDVYLKNLKDANKVVCETKLKVEKEQIQMRIVDAMYTFDKKHLIINFIADERIDFRDLVKDLAARYKTHIELHQMGVRDKAKKVGGYGSCGQKLCCARFLNDFDSISITMAKNQNISLNPTKINGVCGRLLCCLKYENEGYLECKRKLPKIGDKKEVNGQVGQVVSVNLLKQKYTVELQNKEQVEVTLENGSN